MPETPDCKIVPRIPGRPVQGGKKYHLFRDCPQVRASASASEHVDVDDRLIDLLGLSCCTRCTRRSTLHSPQEAMEAAVSYATQMERGRRGEAGLHQLAKLGYEIRYLRKA